MVFLTYTAFWVSTLNEIPPKKSFKKIVAIATLFLYVRISI